MAGSSASAAVLHAVARTDSSFRRWPAHGFRRLASGTGTIPPSAEMGGESSSRRFGGRLLFLCVGMCHRPTDGGVSGTRSVPAGLSHAVRRSPSCIVLRTVILRHAHEPVATGANLDDG